jgi:hypothetical protein
VFIKPHANNEKVKEFVKAELSSAGLSINYEGSMTGPEILKVFFSAVFLSLPDALLSMFVHCFPLIDTQANIIDQHYAAIYEYAIEKPPDAIPVSEEVGNAFKEMYEEDFQSALTAGKVVNAADAMKKLEDKDGRGVAAVWEAGFAKGNLKFAPGVYVAKCVYKMDVNDEGDPVGMPAEEGDDGAEQMYVVNGFYGGVRQAFTAEGASISYFVVGFTSDNVSWAKFRSDIIGSTDPSAAPASSLRGKIYKQFDQLGLEEQPTISLNGVHASAGSIEGLKERMVWLGLTPDQDPFGQKLLEVVWGNKSSKVQEFLQSPTVEFAGAKAPLFDLTEDKDSIEALCICNNLAFATGAQTSSWYGAKAE